MTAGPRLGRLHPDLPIPNANCGDRRTAHPHGPSCAWCGAANPRPVSAYCTKRCAEQAGRWRRRVDRTRTACAEPSCRAPMTPARSSAVYCSTACRAKAWRLRAKGAAG